MIAVEICVLEKNDVIVERDTRHGGRFLHGNHGAYVVVQQLHRIHVWIESGPQYHRKR